jgi:hypothetical protein
MHWLTGSGRQSGWTTHSNNNSATAGLRRGKNASVRRRHVPRLAVAGSSFWLSESRAQEHVCFVTRGSHSGVASLFSSQIKISNLCRKPPTPGLYKLTTR